MATILSASALRRELAARALQHARLHPHEATYGSLPSILFQDHEGAHGNFHPASYRAILANPAWAARLAKVYTGSRRIPHRHHPDLDRTRRELDCAVSSDALLMNVLCYPDILTRPALRALLGLSGSETSQLVFGYRPRLPLLPGRRKKTLPGRPMLDRTEIDLDLGPLLIEAKLTETSFQRAPLSSVQRYPAFADIFDLEDLPIEDPDVPRPMLDSYQLVRGVLAAHHEEKSFVVLCDRRRADLIERWFLILRAIRSAELRSRCALLTWQELATALPATLQDFLEGKYGILPA
jgi:hypothetical protein